MHRLCCDAQLNMYWKERFIMNNITSVWNHMVSAWVHVRDTWQEARKLQERIQHDHGYRGWE